MNKHLIETANKLAASAVALSAFAEKYGDRLPDGLLYASAGVSSEPTVTISTGYRPSDRDKALSLVGEVFGTHGWEAKMTYDREKYDWKRTIDGVHVTISGAESLPPLPQSAPVPPHKFPLQLTDAQSA